MKILIGGESWVSLTSHIKGFDQFSVASFESGAGSWIAALETCAEVVYIPNHMISEAFPSSVEEFSQYDAVMLSDVGANTLLLHPDTWLKGIRTPNRLKSIQEYVKRGGSFAMIGGYLTFQGFEGKGAYHATPIEKVLPVTLEGGDDRLEAPEGLDVTVLESGHPVFRGIEEPWPYLLGMNRFETKAASTVLAAANGLPLLVVGTYGLGKTLAWASDIGPHWCPEQFVQWPGYKTLWGNVAAWLGDCLLS